MKAKLEDFKGEPNKTYTDNRIQIKLLIQTDRTYKIKNYPHYFYESQIRRFQREPNKTYRQTKKSQKMIRQLFD